MNNHECLEWFRVYHLDAEHKFRCGCEQDGGYVVADLANLLSSTEASPYDCYISAGVSTEESFSRDFIERYQMTEYNSFAFDGTIHAYPYDYTNKIAFIRKNIGALNDDAHTNLSYLMEKYGRIFLKMDIEGGEFPWLMSLNTDHLRRFRQIILEVHGVFTDEYECMYQDKLACYKKLADTHYLVHVHGNNYSYMSHGVPLVMELTYVNKELFDVPPPLNTTAFPIHGIDFPNNPRAKDMVLDRPPFCHMECGHMGDPITR